ncbi:MAG: hypothetical protein JRJ87_09930 [Deltaproteobacteria bacterium]|nr:hypothetical protein [Deltaproteobacteria bacterium]
MSHPPRFELDRLAAGELDSRALSGLQSHLDDCADCRKYLATIETEREELLDRKPAELFVDSLESHHLPADRQKRVWVFSLAAATVAAAAVIVILILGNQPEPVDDNMRWMGQGAMTKIYLKRGAISQLLTNQAILPGDQLRFEVALPKGKRAHAAVFAIENNRVTCVLPAQPSAEPYPIRDVLLVPGSLIIEAGESPVDIIVVVRPEPFNLAKVRGEIEKSLGSLGTGRQLSSIIPGLIHQLRVEPNKP